MKRLLNIKDQKSGAEIVDQHLILSLLDAQEPKVWRMALDKIGTASFEVKQEKDSAVTKLILKPKKGTAEIIATYDTKDQAIKALTQASNALQYSESKSEKTIIKSKKTSSKQSMDMVQKENSKWVLVLFGAVIVVGLYMYLSTLIPEKNIGFDSSSSSSQVNETGSSLDRTGVPVSADDFLNSR